MITALNRALALSTLLASLGLPGIAGAQHAGHTTSTHQVTAIELPWADAEVRRIDTAAGKVSLRHGEIKNLDMPPMTMVFQVQDPTQLQALNVGDKVRFTADQVLGAYTVLQIEKRP